MKKEKLVDLIESISPSETADDWDNCGYQINSKRRDVLRILTALEITGSVIDEAETKGCDFIVTHHPLIFGIISKIDCNSITGNYIERLLKADISVYSCHTSFDKAPLGNNHDLGARLGFAEMRVEENGDGFLMSAELPEAYDVPAMKRKTAEALEMSENMVRVAGNKERMIQKVCWCTGSGGSFLKEAINAGADLYITGDLKYHDAVYAAESGIVVFDAGHYGSEKIFARNMKALLENAVSEAEEKCQIYASEIDIDPFLW